MIWIHILIAKQRFVQVSGFKGECGKSLELAFEVFCHDFDSVPLRFVLFRHPENVRSDCVQFTKGRVSIRIDSFDVPGLSFFGIFNEISRDWVHRFDLNVVGNPTANTANPRLSAPVSIPLVSLFPSGSVPDRCRDLVHLCDTNVLLHFCKRGFFDCINKMRLSHDLAPLEWSNHLCLVGRLLTQIPLEFVPRTDDPHLDYFPGLSIEESLSFGQVRQIRGTNGCMDPGVWTGPDHTASPGVWPGPDHTRSPLNPLFNPESLRGWSLFLSPHVHHCGVGYWWVPGEMNLLRFEVVLGTVVDLTHQDCPGKE
jgi:hypothetical protein